MFAESRPEVTQSRELIKSRLFAKGTVLRKDKSRESSMDGVDESKSMDALVLSNMALVTPTSWSMSAFSNALFERRAKF